MSAATEAISILDRRRIEAQIAGPLTKAFIEEVGEEKALSVVRSVIGKLACQSGKDLAKALGGNTMTDLARGLVAWAKGDAYEMEGITLSETEYVYNITRCRYAEMYKEIGLADLGVILSCGRDFELISGFNPKMTLKGVKGQIRGPSVAEQMAREGVTFIRGDNDRIAGRRQMHLRLELDDGQPGLHVHSRCKAWWQTIPLLTESEKHPEDVENKDAPDHCYDETRYALMSRPIKPKAAHLGVPVHSFQWERKKLIRANKARERGRRAYG